MPASVQSIPPSWLIRESSEQAHLLAWPSMMVEPTWPRPPREMRVRLRAGASDIHGALSAEPSPNARPIQLEDPAVEYAADKQPRRRNNGQKVLDPPSQMNNPTWPQGNIERHDMYKNERPKQRSASSSRSTADRRGRYPMRGGRQDRERAAGEDRKEFLARLGPDRVPVALLWRSPISAPISRKPRTPDQERPSRCDAQSRSAAEGSAVDRVH